MFELSTREKDEEAESTMVAVFCGLEWVYEGRYGLLVSSKAHQSAVILETARCPLEFTTSDYLISGTTEFLKSS